VVGVRVVWNLYRGGGVGGVFVVTGCWRGVGVPRGTSAECLFD
jgi:hypothetical protein